MAEAVAVDGAYTVSVRDLCEFAAKAGDLDLRFTPSPTAQQGREGHLLVAQRRGPQHEAEVSLSGDYRGCACVVARTGTTRNATNSRR